MDFCPRGKLSLFSFGETGQNLVIVNTIFLCIPMSKFSIPPPGTGQSWEGLWTNNAANPRLCHLQNDKLRLHSALWFRKQFHLYYLIWSLWLSFKPDNIISIISFGEFIWCVQGHTESGRARRQNHLLTSYLLLFPQKYIWPYPRKVSFQSWTHIRSF